MKLLSVASLITLAACGRIADTPPDIQDSRIVVQLKFGQSTDRNEVRQMLKDLPQYMRMSDLEIVQNSISRMDRSTVENELIREWQGKGKLADQAVELLSLMANETTLDKLNAHFEQTLRKGGSRDLQRHYLILGNVGTERAARSILRSFIDDERLDRHGTDTYRLHALAIALAQTLDHDFVAARLRKYLDEGTDTLRVSLAAIVLAYGNQPSDLERMIKLINNEDLPPQLRGALIRNLQIFSHQRAAKELIRWACAYYAFNRERAEWDAAVEQAGQGLDSDEHPTFSDRWQLFSTADLGDFFGGCPHVTIVYKQDPKTLEEDDPPYGWVGNIPSAIHPKYIPSQCIWNPPAMRLNLFSLLRNMPVEARGDLSRFIKVNIGENQSKFISEYLENPETNKNLHGIWESLWLIENGDLYVETIEKLLDMGVQEQQLLYRLADRDGLNDSPETKERIQEIYRRDFCVLFTQATGLAKELSLKGKSDQIVQALNLVNDRKDEISRINRYWAIEFLNVFHPYMSQVHRELAFKLLEMTSKPGSQPETVFYKREVEEYKILKAKVESHFDAMK